jgi:hypothetical protein
MYRYSVVQKLFVTSAYIISESITIEQVKNADFWDVTPCGSCKNRRFGGTYRLHHEGERNPLASNNVSSN